MARQTCPHCGWGMKLVKDYVDQDGYHGELKCSTCQAPVKISTNLYWSYANKVIPEHLITETENILQSRGMLSTPP
jgi:DNA-directed RNA polymerase subunit M/transcription elongation factor TFIIS|tara:strand:- start:1616 stop:1843 length:228 start_codon:yes stop_codon:yes gene_type:complete